MKDTCAGALLSFSDNFNSNDDNALNTSLQALIHTSSTPIDPASQPPIPPIFASTRNPCHNTAAFGYRHSQKQPTRNATRSKPQSAQSPQISASSLPPVSSLDTNVQVQLPAAGPPSGISHLYLFFFSTSNKRRLRFFSVAGRDLVCAYPTVRVIITHWFDWIHRHRIHDPPSRPSTFPTNHPPTTSPPPLNTTKTPQLFLFENVPLNHHNSRNALRTGRFHRDGGSSLLHAGARGV